MKAKSYVSISPEKIVINDELIFAEAFNAENLPFDSIYKLLNIKYPKYFKMDNLSKLGFLGVEILKQKIDFEAYDSSGVAQIFQNSYSSLDTDLKHQNAINSNKMPSPAIFVYTLPNIVMGEIAIRNQFYGENLFTLTDEFNAGDWIDLATIQLKLGKATAVIGGWIEVFENDFNLRLFLLDNDTKNEIYEIK